MSQLYYPVGGNDFINTTDYVEYSNNLQNIYLNVENNIVRNKNSEPLVELKDSLYKELTSDCNELFQEIIEGINKAKAEKSKEDNLKDPVVSFRNSINEFKKNFLEKQNIFINADLRLKEETKKVEKDLKTLEKMITFINNLDDDYSETEEIKKINENIILLSQKIEKNNILKSAKEDYVKIRIDINECFDIIKSLNNLNYSNTCSLCLTNKVQEFINPCGHCLCSGCKTRFVEYEGDINNENCPICRGFIKDFQPLYL